MIESDNRDKHLNLFYFFSDHEKQYIEDNLTRGLALCLERDDDLLKELLKKIVGKDFESLFDRSEENNVSINIQENVTDVNEVEKLYGVSLTTNKVETKLLDSNAKMSARTDLVIRVNNIAVIFEVKRTAEDCRGQLTSQMRAIQQISQLPDSALKMVSLTWKEITGILRETLFLQEVFSNKVRICKDFFSFIAYKYPEWIIDRRLDEISLPEHVIHLEDQEFEPIRRRIDFLKNQVFSEEVLIGERKSIPIKEYGWANEINTVPVAQDKSIGIQVAPGDTKGQGWKVYKSARKIHWPDHIGKYKVRVHPYIKFSSFTKGLSFVFSRGRELYPETHKKHFFKKFTGRWIRNDHGDSWEKSGVTWEEFIQYLNEFNPDWREKAHWDDRFTNSGKTRFSVSVAYQVTLIIPYEDAQELDKKSSEGYYPLGEEIKKLSNQLIKEINKAIKGK